MRVAIYTRISTDEEHQPYSLESQEIKLKAYIASQDDWQLVKTFTDQASGAKLERPGLRQALAEAKAGRFDLLLVYRVDRFSRSVRGLAQVLEELTGVGVAFRSSTEPFDTTTAAGRMMVQMLGVFAEFERATIIDRVISGMERKVARGEWTAGNRPFGYALDKETKQLVVREDEAAIVPLMFDMYVNKNMGTTVIANTLNERGHRTRGGRPWNKTAILGIVRNRAYIGEIFFRSQYHPASHPHLVDKALFEKAAARLAERGEDYAKRQQDVSPDYLLSGLVTCGRCGKRFLGTAATGSTGRYRYYTCYSRNRYGTDTCGADRLPAGDLDAAVLKSLLETFSRTTLFEDAVLAATQQRAGLKEQQEAELAKAADELRKTEDAIERYLQAFENGTLPEVTFADRIKKLGSRAAELRVTRDELREELDSGHISAPTDDLLEATRSQIAYALNQGNGAEQKRLVQKVVHEIKIEGRHRITPIFRVPVAAQDAEDDQVRAMGGLVGITGLEPVTSAV